MNGLRGSATGLFILRIAFGTIFLLHGWEKLFGNNVSFFQEMLAMSGWLIPEGVLWVVAVVEALAGGALILGVLPSLSSAILAVEMLVAVFLFHVKQGFFIVAVPNVPLAYGFEYHLALLGGLVCLALAGPGRWAAGARARPESPDSPSGAVSPTP